MWAYVYDINNNGFLVGSSSTQHNLIKGYLWRENKTYELLSPINTNPGSSSCAAINNLGYVVGWSHSLNPPGYMHATFWDASSLYSAYEDEYQSNSSFFGIDLGVLDGDSQSYATDISEKNQIVGVSINISSNGIRAFFIDRSFVSPSFNMIDLGFPNNGILAGAEAINNHEQIVGWLIFNESPPYFEEHAVMWEKIQGSWSATDLGILEGNTLCIAHDINNQGVIVGDSSNITTGEKHGFIVFNYQDMVDINDIVDFQSMPEGSFIEEANAINEDGIIAGMAWNGTGHYSPVLLIPKDQ